MTKIPLSQFIKPYKKRESGKSINEGYQGCAQIKYHDTVIAHEIQAIARVVLNNLGPIV